MAFGNKITATTGVSTKYHKISTVYIDFSKGTSTIILDNYLTEDYRKKEKSIEEIRNSINKLTEQAKTNNKDTSTALLQKANKLIEDNQEDLNKNFIASKDTIELNYIPETLTYEAFYKELAKLEKYKDATML